jgi:hypothetical protein
MALSSSPRTRWLVAFLLIAAATIRIFAAGNDLWLDEIWSLLSVRKLASPLEVFTKIHLDNNHYLNSLWLYLFREHDNWPGFRIPSIVLSVGSVAMAGIIARRLNVRATLLAMFLVAFSYMEILYASEARGFASVVFFSFASFYLLERYLEKESWPAALFFSISAILGFASHLIYLNFFCAAILWSGWRLIKSDRGKAQIVKSMLACHAAPAMFFILLYILDVRRLGVGGGTPASLPGTFAQSLGWAFGGPSFVCITLAAVLFMAGLLILSRQHSDLLVFFIGVILVFPILMVTLHHSDAIYVRHFIVGSSFLLILISLVLARLCERGWPRQILCALLLISYFALNSWDVAAVLKYGRGHYTDAVHYLIQNTKRPEITVGSDHDFRVSLVLRYYVDQASGDQTFTYYPRSSWPHQGPEWLVYHKESIEDPSSAQANITDDFGNHYELEKTFPTAPLSGLHWFVYRNKGRNSSNP